MKFTVNRTELLAAAQNAERIAPKVSTIEILQCAYLQAEQDTLTVCLLYTSPSPRDKRQSRMPSSA